MDDADATTAPRPVRRLAFVGQSTFFEACSLDAAGAERAGTTAEFLEFREGGDADRLLAQLEAFAPEAVVVFRPEVLPRGVV